MKISTDMTIKKTPHLKKWVPNILNKKKKKATNIGISTKYNEKSNPKMEISRRKAVGLCITMLFPRQQTFLRTVSLHPGAVSTNGNKVEFWLSKDLVWQNVQRSTQLSVSRSQQSQTVWINLPRQWHTYVIVLPRAAYIRYDSRTVPEWRHFERGLYKNLIIAQYSLHLLFISSLRAAI